MNSEESTEQKLALSVKQYREILDHAEKLVSMVSSANYAELESYSKELNILQAEAQQNDKKLLPTLFHEPQKWQANSLFQQRQELIQKIIDFNRKMMPSLKAALAVAADDMNRLHNGRTAVAGYTDGLRSKGRIKSSA